jgi:hypothetical protein
VPGSFHPPIKKVSMIHDEISVSSYSVAGSRVDRTGNGAIYGFKVATLGEARGHGVIVDDVTLQQIEQLGNAAGGIGVKSRYTHPEQADGLGTLLGKASNFRRKGDSVIADLHFLAVAHTSPSGNLATYVMDLAESAPDSFGASPNVKLAKERVPGQSLPSLRVKELKAVDFVDDPATNEGLFSTHVAAGTSSGPYVTQGQADDVAAKLDYAIEYQNATPDFQASNFIEEYVAGRLAGTVDQAPAAKLPEWVNMPSDELAKLSAVPQVFLGSGQPGEIGGAFRV